MKKTTKKLSINKETISSFSEVSGKEMNGVKGGYYPPTHTQGDLASCMTMCRGCYTDAKAQ